MVGSIIVSCADFVTSSIMWARIWLEIKEISEEPLLFPTIIAVLTSAAIVIIIVIVAAIVAWGRTLRRRCGGLAGGRG